MLMLFFETYNLLTFRAYLRDKIIKNRSVKTSPGSILYILSNATKNVKIIIFIQTVKKRYHPEK